MITHWTDRPDRESRIFAAANFGDVESPEFGVYVVDLPSGEQHRFVANGTPISDGID
jgi:hypothetical protein